ncbi:hypothetical protein LMG22931_05617 [Paraburkholderia nemoris]|nr:hypothetical protein LMG22931_05617 [Paraburkholderia nemoris]
MNAACHRPVLKDRFAICHGWTAVADLSDAMRPPRRREWSPAGALSSEFKSTTSGRRRQTYKIASNVRRKNNFLQCFLTQTCSQCLYKPRFDWPCAGTKSQSGHPVSWIASATGFADPIVHLLKRSRRVETNPNLPLIFSSWNRTRIRKPWIRQDDAGSREPTCLIDDRSQGTARCPAGRREAALIRVPALRTFFTILTGEE